MQNEENQLQELDRPEEREKDDSQGQEEKQKDEEIREDKDEQKSTDRETDDDEENQKKNEKDRENMEKTAKQEENQEKNEDSTRHEEENTEASENGEEKEKDEENITKEALARNLSDLFGNMLQRNPLPHFCVYITWVTLVATMATCAFFLILYSMQWGSTTSAEWLASFFASFVESLFLLEPVKVGGLRCQ